MASIDNPVLNIQINSSTQKATVVVLAQVSFAPNESALGSRLGCRIIGDDPIRDETLFSMDPHLFTNPSSPQSVRLEKTDVSRSALNEDLIGRDEIVAELTLEVGGGATVTKRTNVFQIQ